MSRRFVLLDRDGTINEEIGYVLRPDELRLIPGAADALRELRDLGLGLVVLTNQSPIGRGMLSVDELEAIHARLWELLAEEGVTLDRIEVCPHRPDEGCACRKPGTLMVERAAAALAFDPGEAWIVGDHATDLRLGRAVGARTILVLTGHGREELGRQAGEHADHVVADLREAASLIRDELMADRDHHLVHGRREGGVREKGRGAVNVDRVREYLLETSRTAARTADACAEPILGATAAIVESLRGGGKVLLCGNGGSAGDAQHLATEFVSTLTVDRRRDAIAAIALTTDTSLLTAVANDFGFDGVFARQVEALGRQGDVLVGISTSGNSENVVRAFAQARTAGIRTIALTGEGPGKLAPLADIEINVPSSETSHIQEAHIAVGQLIAFLVEDELFPRS